MRRTNLWVAAGSILLMGGGAALADRNVGQVKRSAKATITVRAASNKNVAGYERMATADGQIFMSPEVLLGAADIVSAGQNGGELSIQVTADAASRLAGVKDNELALFVGNDLVAVTPAGIAGDIVSLDFSRMPQASFERIAGTLNVARPAPLGPSFSLVPREPTIQPDGILTVDVFVNGATDLRAYQAAVDVTGGQRGTLKLEDLVVDVDNPGFVFAGQEAVQAVDKVRGRLTSAMYAGGIKVTRPSYAGTFVFRASPDAQGTFSVEIRNNRDSQFRNSQSGQIGFHPGEPVLVTVGPVSRPGE